MRYWTECREFFAQFRDQYQTTGSLLPSSRALARAMTRPMGQRDEPCRILEVGPGTGAVTAEIVRRMNPGDTLDIVEINGAFLDTIRRRFDTEPSFRNHRGRTRLIHAPLQEVGGESCYDYLISGLPHNNFPIALVTEIFRSYQRLLTAEGVLSYFEYVWVRDLKQWVVSAEEGRRLRELSDFLANRLRASQIAAEVVVPNVPPAIARHLCFRE